jgi:hypothetical protein
MRNTERHQQKLKRNNNFMAKEITLSIVAPGVRVRDEDGFVGTVRYIGPVAR